MHTLDDLRHARYVLLRTYRRDGSPVDTPIWFALDGAALVFRTKDGPKTRRLTRDPRVRLQVCDYRGRVAPGASVIDGRASIIHDAAAAASANDLLRRRYGWQYNVVPLLKIPGLRNVHSDLSWREKLRRTRDRGVWGDSAIVRVEL